MSEEQHISRHYDSYHAQDKYDCDDVSFHMIPHLNIRPAADRVKHTPHCPPGAG